MTIRVGVMGAGSVGSFLGLVLSAAGMPVTLVTRSRPRWDRHTLSAVSLGRSPLRAGPDLEQSTDPTVLGNVDLCIVSVKSFDTPGVTNTLAEVLSRDTVVASFQNGMRNPRWMRACLAAEVVPGVVAFNLHRDGHGSVVQDTRGALFLGHSQQMPEIGEILRRAFARSGVCLHLRSDIEDVMAGKLLMNLANGVCAATGLGIMQLVEDRDARWCFRRCITEGLLALRAHGFHPAAVRVLSPTAVANILRMPNAVVSPIARGLLSARREARVSTLQDLDRGQRTEIDDLQGEVVRIAESHHLRCPANTTVLNVVRGHEQAVAANRPPAFLSASRLRARIERA